MQKKVRVRFAPSPTGGLHLGGVRTALYNYLFARHHGGDFILRIEDTDQNRYVPGAEQYIRDCLDWCGITPDESPSAGGPYGPYRQSERKGLYRSYAEKLLENGHAYMAFDTPAELEEMRIKYKTDDNPSPQYNAVTRKKMRNSESLSAEEVTDLLNKQTPYVIRIRMPDNEEIQFTDMIRGKISFNASQVDDKVLLKADGMPTYHLAVVVDDYLMKITHAFRGEEWLSSSPVHILLWRWLGWEAEMPEWAHLPLILKPDGKGKLSKRDGDRLGFPVFAMDWKDPATGEVAKGFRERGFLPEAFINMLAMLGWNDGSAQEIFTKEELTEKFSIDRVHKAGAKFNYEKAKWFNHEWIKRSSDEWIAGKLIEILNDKKISASPEIVVKVAGLIKERCAFLDELWPNSHFFFETPAVYDLDAIRTKWNEEKKNLFTDWIDRSSAISDWSAPLLEKDFKDFVASRNIKPGDALMPLRIMLAGSKTGPGVFDIAELIGKEETIKRIQSTIGLL
ncbi:MAG: glutamate--tRNA ligase [Chitinophagaceae bacterium]|nr:glutamate--tRNA ligase [Chitinophagaceae bacterium]